MMGGREERKVCEMEEGRQTDSDGRTTVTPGKSDLPGWATKGTRLPLFLSLPRNTLESSQHTHLEARGHIQTCHEHMRVLPMFAQSSFATGALWSVFYQSKYLTVLAGMFWLKMNVNISFCQLIRLIPFGSATQGPQKMNSSGLQFFQLRAEIETDLFKRLAADMIADTFAFVFHRNLCPSVTSNTWKSAAVPPLLKHGDRSDLDKTCHARPNYQATAPWQRFVNDVVNSSDSIHHRSAKALDAGSRTHHRMLVIRSVLPYLRGEHYTCWYLFIYSSTDLVRYPPFLYISSHFYFILILETLEIRQSNSFKCPQGSLRAWETASSFYTPRAWNGLQNKRTLEALLLLNMFKRLLPSALKETFCCFMWLTSCPYMNIFIWDGLDYSGQWWVCTFLMFYS